ncbi:MAG: hypothetical protein JXA42_24805, partial [Anaerolineales bacterium]|nr:hypothetical protein [Anaerolineales bacterium]
MPNLINQDVFSEILYDKMKDINPGIKDLELYEFRYALNTICPENGEWSSVKIDTREDIEERIQSTDFYTSIPIKSRIGDRIVLDENIVRLTNMLFVGLETGEYPVEWVRAHFYFDIRGFYFLTRTTYFTDAVKAYLGSEPLLRFEHQQMQFERYQDLGYKAFK